MMEDEVSDKIDEYIMRIISEALTNIARHASAGQAAIDIIQLDGKLRIEIKDDGKGFDPDSVPPGHYGLIGMRERTRIAGGSMVIESQSGQGTILKFDLPLDQSNA